MFTAIIRSVGNDYSYNGVVYTPADISDDNGFPITVSFSEKVKHPVVGESREFGVRGFYNKDTKVRTIRVVPFESISKK